MTGGVVAIGATYVRTSKNQILLHGTEDDAVDEATASNRDAFPSIRTRARRPSGTIAGRVNIRPATARCPATARVRARASAANEDRPSAARWIVVATGIDAGNGPRTASEQSNKT